MPWSEQQWEFLSVLMQNSLRENTAGAKKLHRRAETFTEAMKGGGTEARPDEKCMNGQAMKITEQRKCQAEKIRKSANDKLIRK